MELLHYMDAETERSTIKKPLFRPDAPELHPNPVRRFREEMRMTRDEFAYLVGVPVETLRSWERDHKAMVPNHPRLKRLITIARRNYYPLYVKDMVKFAEKSRQ